MTTHLRKLVFDQAEIQECTTDVAVEDGTVANGGGGFFIVPTAHERLL